jgi:hypothetical protein
VLQEAVERSPIVIVGERGERKRAPRHQSLPVSIEREIDVRQEEQHEGGDDRIDRTRLRGRLFRVADLYPHVLQPELLGNSPRSLDHARREIDAYDSSLSSDCLGCRDQRSAGSGADVEHRRPPPQTHVSDQRLCDLTREVDSRRIVGRGQLIEQHCTLNF